MPDAPLMPPFLPPPPDCCHGLSTHFAHPRYATTTGGYVGTRWQYTAGSGHNSDKTFEYCGRQSSTLFTVIVQHFAVTNLQLLNVYFGYPRSVG